MPSTTPHPTPSGVNAICCIGGANIDRKLRADQALRMGTSNPATLHESAGGVARNVAENLVRLGLEVQLLTAVGDDDAGRGLLAQVQALGVRTQGSLRVAGEATGSYTAVLDAQGELVLALAHMALAEQLSPAFLAQTQALRAGTPLWLMDLNLPAASILALAQEAAQSGARLVAVAVSEPKMARLGASLQGIDTLVLNRGELQAYSGAPLPSSPPESGVATPDLLDALSATFTSLHQRGLQRLVVSLGAQGLAYGDAALGHMRMQHLSAAPLPAQAVIDVNGAGDALCAGVCAGLAQEPPNLRGGCQLGLTLAALALQSHAGTHPDVSPALLQCLHDP